MGPPVRIYPRIVLAAAVVAVLGVAGAAPVPGHLGELVTSAPADDLVASLTIQPGQNESRRYVVEARDARGRLVGDVIGSDILFTYLDGNVGVAGVSEAVLRRAGVGRFEGEGRELAITGRWRAEVVLRRAGRPDAWATFGVAVAPLGAPTLATGPLYPPTAASVAEGAGLYRAQCAICHGLDARGDGPLAASLSPRPSDLIVHVPQHPDSDLEGWIANGIPGTGMPAFRDRLTEEQRWSVVNYLKSLVSSAATNR
jgi:mono/diheme cytochrome c family protein